MPWTQPYVGQPVSAPQGPPPVITGATGTLTRQATLTITGHSFGGSGPSVLLFEDFEEAGAVAGNNVPTTGQFTGSWTTNGAGGFPQVTYDSNFLSGALSGRMYGATQVAEILVSLPSVIEIFISYWVMVPAGTYFPSATAVQTFPTGSAWKFCWLYDAHTDGTDSDVCLPSYIGNSLFKLTGNANVNLGASIGTQLWVWDAWQRQTIWAQADPNNLQTNGNFFWQWLSAANGLSVPRSDFTNSTPIFAPGNYSPTVYKNLKFAGFMNSNQTNVRPVYDDIYVATGSNSQARVELGDQATYNSCTKLHLQIPTSWNANSITCQCAPGQFSTGSTPVYVYVHDGNGNVNTSGFLLQ